MIGQTIGEMVAGGIAGRSRPLTVKPITAEELPPVKFAPLSEIAPLADVVIRQPRASAGDELWARFYAALDAPRGSGSAIFSAAGSYRIPQAAWRSYVESGAYDANLSITGARQTKQADPYRTALHAATDAALAIGPVTNDLIQDTITTPAMIAAHWAGWAVEHPKQAGYLIGEQVERFGNWVRENPEEYWTGFGYMVVGEAVAAEILPGLAAEFAFGGASELDDVGVLAGLTGREARLNALSRRAAELRAELPVGLRFDSRGMRVGNIGVADIEIEGVATQLRAFSRYDAEEGWVSLQTGDTILRPSAVNPAQIVNGPGAYLRDVDTEFRILEKVARDLRGSPNARGSINLYTERTPCPSCVNVISQFRQLHPNVEVNLYTGALR